MFFACLCLLTWPRSSRYARYLPVVCVFYLFILACLNQNFRIHTKNLGSLCFLLVCTCLLGQKFQDLHENCLWFVVFSCLYLLTWTRISGFARKISVVCVFYLFVLAYLAKNFRTRTKIACGLWFLPFHTYLLGSKFQDSRENSV